MVGKTVLSLNKMEMIMIRANQIIEIKIQNGMEQKNVEGLGYDIIREKK